jgi:prephenate dehydrogenase
VGQLESLAPAGASGKTRAFFYPRQAALPPSILSHDVPFAMPVLWPTVTIVGVGLIGGSAGLALARRGLAERIIGVGRSSGSLAVARDRGAVTEATTDLAAAVAAADFVLVATRVGLIGSQLAQIDAAVRPGTLITDAGSTKESIVAAWEAARPSRRGRFVGSHPLAGSHERGPQAADAELFSGRLAVLTPVAETPQDDVEAVRQFWTAIGAETTELNPTDHDALLAAASHTPHLVAAALAAATPAAARPLTAGGWRDTTRVAAGDPELWTDILLDNAAAVAGQLDAVATGIDQLRQAIAAGDRETLIHLLTLAKESRDALGS